MSPSIKRLIILSGVCAWMMSAAAPALAAHLEIEASVPDSVQAGEIIEVRVIVRSSETSERVPSATVAAYRDASILGVDGRVEIATATADHLGVATLRWQERGGSSDTVILAYAQHDDETLESDPVSIVTVGPGPQIVRSTSGIRIPGIGAWVVIALLVTIWGIIQLAMVGPIQVARAGVAHASAADQDAQEGEPSK